MFRRVRGDTFNSQEFSKRYIIYVANLCMNDEHDTQKSCVMLMFLSSFTKDGILSSNVKVIEKVF